MILNIADCEYGEYEWGVYANSTEEYWTKVDYKTENMVDHFDKWNDSSLNWNRTNTTDMSNIGEYFR